MDDLSADEVTHLLHDLFCRRDCPSSDALAEYHLDLLAPGQRLSVARHLRECARCRWRLSLIGMEEESQEQETGLLAGLGSFVTRVLWGSPVPAAHAVPVRGGQTFQRFQIEAAQIDVIVTPNPLNRLKRDVAVHTSGLAQPEAISVSLVGDAAATTPHTLDEFGSVQLARIEPGHYALRLVEGEKEIWLEPVEVN